MNDASENGNASTDGSVALFGGMGSKGMKRVPFRELHFGEDGLFVYEGRPFTGLASRMHRTASSCRRSSTEVGIGGGRHGSGFATEPSPKSLIGGRASVMGFTRSGTKQAT